MIPKIIHFCWFGRGEYSDLIKKCIKSWNDVLSDYKIILWNEDNFDINSTIYTREAYEAKKYAFVSDYVRLYALLNYGGIYLDTDVEIIKNFDDFLSMPGFAGIEAGWIPACGVLGSEKDNVIIQEFFDFYKDRSFYNDLGEYDLTPNPCRFETILKKYGFKNKNEFQEVFVKGRRTFVFYKQEFFYPAKKDSSWGVSDKTIAIHHYDGSWLREKDLLQIETENNITRYKKMFGNRRGERIYHSKKRIEKYGILGWIKFLINRKRTK